MPSCSSSISSILTSLGIPGFDELPPFTATPFSMNFVLNKMFVMEVTSFQTVTFNVNLSASPFPINFVIHIFSTDGTTATDLGSITLVDTFTVFTKDLDIGQYIVCIRTNSGSYTGQITQIPQSYIAQARLQPRGYFGLFASSELTIKRQEQYCAEPIFFEITEGSLPPGLFMNSIGVIQGELPLLDCIDVKDEYSPSQNWYYTENDGKTYPWGRQWRFKVKIQLGSFDDATAEQWFCMRVHNNWTFDQEVFLSQMPFRRIKQFEVIELPKKLEPLCFEPCETNTPEETPLQPIPQICGECVNPDVDTSISLIEIPVQVAGLQPPELVTWYLENKNSRGDCCEELRQFLLNLDNNKSFQNYVNQFVEEPPDNQFVFASLFNKFLQLAESSLIEGRNSDDIDYIMDGLKSVVNQKLPTTGNAHCGESLWLTIS